MSLYYAQPERARPADLVSEMHESQTLFAEEASA